MIVVVPDAHAFALGLFEVLDTCFATSLINESALFDGLLRPGWNKYALQMAIKLLIAQHVTTNYYITLDADVVLVGSIDVHKILPGGKAMYVAEPQSVHPHWWVGSTVVLGLEAASYSNSTFGVTPAVLSTFGAQVAAASVRDRSKQLDWQHFWLKSWGVGIWWSEYSLYRLALDTHGLFDELHALPKSNVLCHAVWYEGQLPWDSAAAYDSADCVFSLVQSTTHADPSVIACSVSRELSLRRRPRAHLAASDYSGRKKYSRLQGEISWA